MAAAGLLLQGLFTPRQLLKVDRPWEPLWMQGPGRHYVIYRNILARRTDLPRTSPAWLPLPGLASPHLPKTLRAVEAEATTGLPLLCTITAFRLLRVVMWAAARTPTRAHKWAEAASVAPDPTAASRPLPPPTLSALLLALGLALGWAGGGPCYPRLHGRVDASPRQAPLERTAALMVAALHPLPHPPS